MKPAPFGYERPTMLEEALDVMSGEDVVALAGGQSLMPLLARREVRPRIVCDLNRVDGLAGIQVGAESVTIGAATRQRDVELHPQLLEVLPLLAQAVATIGFVPVRHRGTIGGSLSHADPCAELPTAALLLGATLLLRSTTGRREVAAADFFTGDFRTCLEAGELVVSVRFPMPAVGTSFGAVKLRAAQDRAVGCQTATTVVDGVIASARVAVFGGGGPSGRLGRCEQALRGVRVGDRSAVAAAARAGAAQLPPLAGAFRDHQHRQHLAGVAIERAVAQAVEVGDARD
ncbi:MULTISPECIES: FAD binding domain-containing protein [unclassified Nocardioides]|uniref:FAD binding domain-containing protein n=1 Tax=unclassified Nocardioides TaxID=2615069 RepID=UPI0009F0AD74|nr:MULTISPECIES: FAD binding domain-containing protein [unclassified Nocardioides]GAW49151.1 Putative carbon monoxide dehydrogenase medium subunit [Nocardioides sp. PD653-B2]GAW55639.1 putative carbon monoxide dehydrogenase medium subunit [Nocardioides sp. PD653]